jgi:hypothetical protein
MPAASVGTCHGWFALLKRGPETNGEVTGLAFKILVEDPDDALYAQCHASFIKKQIKLIFQFRDHLISKVGIKSGVNCSEPFSISGFPFPSPPKSGGAFQLGLACSHISGIIPHHLCTQVRSFLGVQLSHHVKLQPEEPEHFNSHRCFFTHNQCCLGPGSHGPFLCCPSPII